MTYGDVTELFAPLIVMSESMPYFAFILRPEVHPKLPAIYAAPNAVAVDVGWVVQAEQQYADLVLNVRHPEEFVVRIRCSMTDDGDRMTLATLLALPRDPMVIFYPTKDEAAEAVLALKSNDSNGFMQRGVGVYVLDCSALRALKL